VHYGVARAFADVTLSVKHDLQEDTISVSCWLLLLLLPGHSAQGHSLPWQCTWQCHVNCRLTPELGYILTIRVRQQAHHGCMLKHRLALHNTSQSYR